jgi:para-nitrobenzyl esterase
MTHQSSRRAFVKDVAFAFAGACAGPRLAFSADSPGAIATTSSGKVRGATLDGINIFKGIPYGATTAGTNRFMPTARPRRRPSAGRGATFPPKAKTVSC